MEIVTANSIARSLELIAESLDRIASGLNRVNELLEEGNSIRRDLLEVDKIGEILCPRCEACRTPIELSSDGRLPEGATHDTEDGVYFCANCSKTLAIASAARGA